jgi:hypothetical protein
MLRRLSKIATNRAPMPTGSGPGSTTRTVRSPTNRRSGTARRSHRRAGRGNIVAPHDDGGTRPGSTNRAHATPLRCSEWLAEYLWDGRGAEPYAALWHDDATGPLWLDGGGNRLVNLSLSPEVWIERACNIVGRDFAHDDEWERFVPGDEPLTSACR